MRYWVAVLLGASVACAGTDPSSELDDPTDAGAVRDAGLRDTSDLPFARDIVEFDSGEGAGYGADMLPDVISGPPTGSPVAGSLDVVSLGVGGTIVVSFGDKKVVDGEGPDFIIFENAFWVKGDPNVVFAELGEVAVSTDAASWHTFQCDPTPLEPPWPGCAGWRPTMAFDPFDPPMDVTLMGGDPFDLADVGLTEATHVRIRDLATGGAPPSAGFDLDAVGMIHFERR